MTTRLLVEEGKRPLAELRTASQRIARPVLLQQKNSSVLAKRVQLRIFRQFLELMLAKRIHYMFLKNGLYVRACSFSARTTYNQVTHAELIEDRDGIFGVEIFDQKPFSLLQHEFCLHAIRNSQQGLHVVC